MNDMKINYDSFLWISVFLMIIVALGTIGNALIILLKRKRSLAISLAVGATPRQLFLEFLSEVFLTIQTGVLLGLAVSAFITPQLSNTFCVVKNHVLTWLIVIAGGTLTTLLVSAVSYLLFRTEPSRTIHGI
jgi:ABC-type antimicrobial peptide transport system permease subunit